MCNDYNIICNGYIFNDYTVLCNGTPILYFKNNIYYSIYILYCTRVLYVYIVIRCCQVYSMY